MPNVVLPNIAGSAKPSEADVNQADAAIVAVVGGVAGGVRYPGAIALDNFAAAGRGFRNAQKLEGRSRAVITGSNRGAQIPYDVLVDTVQFWHTHPTPVKGEITLNVAGQVVATLKVPDPNGYQQLGAVLQPYTVIEWRVPPFLAAARAAIDVGYAFTDDADAAVAFDTAAKILSLALWGVAFHVK